MRNRHDWPKNILQVGKSLLIKCLVKHYTKHNLSEVRGPITVVSGLYFIFCLAVALPSLLSDMSLELNMK